MPFRYDLRSDTVTRPTEAMKRAMIEAPLGDDVLGDDPTVKRLEETIAERAGMEAALLFPSGTQANQAAIWLHTDPGTEAIVERKAHVFNYEAGAPAALSGVQLHPVDTQDGAIRLEDVEGLVRPVNEHFPQTRLLCLENTHNGHGGRVYPIDEMEAVAGWAGDTGLAVHLDGARIFNAVVASRVSLERYAGCADTMSICLSKGLGAPVGTCLIGESEAIDRARWVRKRLGGGMRQAGILAAAGLHALENHVDRLAVDHSTARGIAEGLGEVDGVVVDPKAVETNIVLIEIDAEGVGASDVVATLSDLDVGILATGPRTLRAVTHLDVPSDASDVIPRRFHEALDALGGR